MKNKPVIIIAITLLIIAAISFFVIRPVVSSVLIAWNELNSSKENLKIIEEKKAILDGLKNDSNVKTVASIADKYIPQNEDSGELILELAAMAQTNKLKVEQTSLEKSQETKTAESTEETGAKPESAVTPIPAPTPAPDAKKIGFSMSVAGTFPDFMNFLRSIESSTRLITLDDISMQSKVGTDNVVAFTAEISGTAYYKKDTSLTDDLDNIKITDETMQRFVNLVTYGKPIDLPTEEDFGRTNPFENYK